MMATTNPIHAEPLASDPPEHCSRRRQKEGLCAPRLFELFEDPRKDYRQRFPTRDLITKAEGYRANHLANPTGAEDAFADILTRIGVAFRREVIYYRAGSFIIIDFLCKAQNVAFEIDGSIHARRAGYDRGRDQWLMQAHGIMTIRLSNTTVIYNRGACVEVVRGMLNA